MYQPSNLQAMNGVEYKLYHESFMQNNHGSSAFHTFACILFTVLCCVICSIGPGSGRPGAHFREFFIIILPLVLVHTIFSGYIYEINCVAAVILLTVLSRNLKKSDIVKCLNVRNSFTNKRLLCISSMRGLTYLITVFCILAVDFRVFPRSLAKTEKYGYSLMDTGVGLFTLMSGLVHRDYSKGNVKYFLKDNFKLIVILSILGISRIVLLDKLDYQQHVTEYGVHWNFFFTLAVTKLLSLFILHISETNHNLILGASVLVFHETVLYLGAEQWVFSDAPRDNFLSANREGVSSSLGYVAMYLIAVYFRKLLCNIHDLRRHILYKLIFISLSSWVLSSAIHIYRPASRVLANAGYCTFLVAILVTVLLILYCVEVIFQEVSDTMYDLPAFLTAINSNGLYYFLGANLITGAVNLSVRTLLVTNFAAIIILIVYMMITTILVNLIHKQRPNTNIRVTDK